MTYKTLNHNISNMDFLIKITGMCYSSTLATPRFLPLPNVPTEDVINRIGINATRTQIEIYAARDRTMYAQSYVTLEYTKTTD